MKVVSVGVIVIANRQNLLSDLEAIELLDQIRQDPGIWIGQKVIQTAVDAIMKRSQVG